MPENRLKISVVIPAYNEATTIGACLESLQGQSVDEVIVVDNNSTDGTADIARSYSGVTVVHEPQQGVVHARTTAFNSANYEIIARIDADTRVMEGWADAIREYFETHPDVDALAGLNYLYGTPVAGWWNGRLDKKTGSRPAGLFSGNNMAMRQQAWQKVRTETSTRTDLFDDIDMALCLTQRVGGTIHQLFEMRAEVSARRYLSSPWEYRQYARAISRTLKHHEMRGMKLNLLLALNRLEHFAVWAVTRPFGKQGATPIPVG
ncbi:glycosyltransferase family 2 protein [Hoyosella sp. YIM 151337]|uniref:glycosyltransferase n=1 Tax=Hoyosella sp. YIM 151337 TaxID=2992742 RepID=UPI0022358A3E|nr:glycosyltransferase family A protein [Hoyosella sp. YIM 151337]MCW4352003.1 glycosyltransferase family 2 protein [Hoyosella sp. YIM 151337]